MPIQSINPATEEILATYDQTPPEEIERALTDAAAAFRRWRAVTFDERAALFRRFAATLRSEKVRLASLITLEMGKPITQAEGEIEKCAWNCDFYAEHAERFLAHEHTPSNATESYVAFAPLGVVLAVMPWNFPFWQVLRFAAPALMAGNVALLKHSSNVPQCALAIDDLFRAAGFPSGVFRTLLVESGAVEKLIADRRISAVTLTGSDEAGAKVAAAAGTHLRKTVLELGGSDPFIVLADADLDEAAKVAPKARNQNAGQSCIAAKRFIVQAAVGDEFERRFVEAVRALRVGDPFERDTDVGPLARADLRETVDSQVRRSVEHGARLVLGGEPRTGASGRGYYYAPTVLADVTDGMPAWQEETFGPVAALVRLKEVEEIIAAANDCQYGLGANLWTMDETRGQALARRIEAGFVAINGMVASDPRLPFGGVKRSGYGRELGVYGIREFVNIQTIWIGPEQKPEQKTDAAGYRQDDQPTEERELAGAVSRAPAE